LLDLFFLRGTVDSVSDAAGRMRYVRVSGSALEGLKWKPGQQVRIDVAEHGFMPVLRTYSIWDYQDSTLGLYVLDHGEGPGSRWVRKLQPGDNVVFTKPQGDFILRPGRYHLFAGEETASVAFGPMLRALPDGVRAYGVIEVDSPADRLPLPSVSWQYRNGAPAAESSTLVAAVKDLDLPGGLPGVAYLAGEARTIQAIRAHLVDDRGWPRRSILTKPFWTPGKTGLE
jgi:NADPH-dependent ferric siderophore reductase